MCLLVLSCRDCKEEVKGTILLCKSDKFEEDCPQVAGAVAGGRWPWQVAGGMAVEGGRVAGGMLTTPGSREATTTSPGPGD